MIDASTILSGTVSGGTVTGQAITADAASTNVLDLGSARDIGAGDDVYFVFTVTEAFDALTSMNIRIQSSADNSSYVDLLISPEILLAALIIGATLVYTLPRKQLNDPAGGTPNRYLRAYYDITGAGPSVGRVLGYVTAAKDAIAYQSYPNNYTAA